jgi:hypothetical protein
MQRRRRRNLASTLWRNLRNINNCPNSNEKSMSAGASSKRVQRRIIDTNVSLDIILSLRSSSGDQTPFTIPLFSTGSFPRVATSGRSSSQGMLLHIHVCRYELLDKLIQESGTFRHVPYLESKWLTSGLPFCATSHWQSTNPFLPIRTDCNARTWLDPSINAIGGDAWAVNPLRL